MFLEHLTAFGGRIVDAGGHVVVDEPAAIRALTFMRDALGAGGFVPASALTWQEEQTRFAFQNGDAVFMRNWPYAWALLQDRAQSAVAGRFAVTTFPAGENGRPAAALGGAELAVNRWSRHPELAEALARFLTAPEQMLERARFAAQLPARRSLYRRPRARRGAPDSARPGPGRARRRGLAAGDAGLHRTVGDPAGRAASSPERASHARGRSSPRRVGHARPSRACRARRGRTAVTRVGRTLARDERWLVPVLVGTRARLHPGRFAGADCGDRLGGAARARPAAPVARPPVHRPRQLHRSRRRSALPRRSRPHRHIRGDHACRWSSPSALALALFMHTTTRGRGAVRLAALLPWAIPTVVAALVVRFMFDGQTGVATAMLRSAGLARAGIRLARAPARRLGANRPGGHLEDDAVCRDPAAGRTADDRSGASRGRAASTGPVLDGGF